MLWRAAGIAAGPSALDALLGREPPPSLNELLTEDEVVQECKALNGRLVERLRERSAVQGLLGHALGLATDAGDAAPVNVSAPEPSAEAGGEELPAAAGEAATEAGGEGGDVEGQGGGAPDSLEGPPAPRKNLAFVACEVLCCDVDAICAALLEDEELVHLLLSFPLQASQGNGLDPVHSGYFSRILSALLQHRMCDRLLLPLRTEAKYLEALVSHVGTTSIAAVLSQLVGGGTPEMAAPMGMLGAVPFTGEWLKGSPLLSLLLTRLEGGHGGDGGAIASEECAEQVAAAQRNAASVLAAAAQRSPALRPELASEETLGRLLALLGGGGESGRSDAAVIAASSVLFAFLRPPEGDGMLGQMDGLSPGGGPDGGGLEEGDEEEDGGKEAVLRLLLVNADRLAAILDFAEAGAEERTPRRLGIRRLSIVRLCSECVCAAVNLWLTSPPESPGRSELEAGLLGFLRSPVVPSVLGLFAVHPFHSILHHHTCRMLYAVLDSHDPALICALVKECGLAQWAAGAAIDVNPLSNAAPLEGKSEAKPALRAGYCGHLTRLGNRLYTLGVVFEEVRTATEEACPEWGAWVQSYVQAQNNRENIYQWACGRPAAEDDLIMDDDDEEDDGDEGLGMHITPESIGLTGVSFGDRYGVGGGDDEGVDEDEDDEFFGAGAAGQLRWSDTPPGNAGADDDEPGEEDAGGSADLEVLSALHRLSVAGEGRPRAANAQVGGSLGAVTLEQVLQSEDEDGVVLSAGESPTGAEAAAPRGERAATPALPQGAPGAEAATGEFGSFSFWKTGYTYDVPEDL